MEQLLWIYLSIFVVLFGACAGSFLNVCIYRIPREESVVWPGSHCPGCNKPIAWYDNIPVLSFIILRGRCRRCTVSISIRYVLVETLTAICFYLVWHLYGWDIRTPIYWLFAFGLLLGTFVDFEHMIIPDRVTIGGMITGVLISALFPALHGTPDRLTAIIAALAGLAAGFGLLWLVARAGKYIFKKDAMGFGDVKLLGAIGAFLGWKAVLFTVVISSLIGSLVGVTLIVVGQKQWQSRIPYGPYLALAAFIWILCGTEILDWYLNLLRAEPF